MRLFARRVGTHEAADLVQESFVRLAGRRRELPAINSPIGFLHGIAAHLVRNPHAAAKRGRYPLKNKWSGGGESAPPTPVLARRFVQSAPQGEDMMRSFVGGSALAMAFAVATGPALAQSAETRNFNLPAGLPIGDALNRVALESGRNLVAPDALLAGKTAPTLAGAYTADGAVARLLLDSGLRVRSVRDALIVERGDARPLLKGERDIVVTETRIRGTGPVGATVTTISREDIDRSGLGTTTEILQTIPQNFGGGPNEANAGVSARGDAPSNSAYGASIDLRGLGE